MSEYILLTDSSCDLPLDLAEKMDLKVLPLTVYIDNDTYANTLDEREITFKDFYERILTAKNVKTSGINHSQFENGMRPYLEKGIDILYIGFSSALSGTYSAGEIAAEELRTEFPQRTILTVDSLCASLGQGLLLYLLWQKKNSGFGIKELRDYAEKIKYKICHWYTVNDLMFLHKGGRVSAGTAVVGSLVNIKPVMHMDNEGKLTGSEVARGRKNSLRALIDKMKKLGTDMKDQTIFISHGNCEEEAQRLADMIHETFLIPKERIYINYVGPVIGAHTGPGVISVFFVGTER